MNTPAVSLFNEAESIKINTSLERHEEEEALADQKRRHEELGAIMFNAFDDLDDGEATLDSAPNSQSFINGVVAAQMQHLDQNENIQLNQHIHHYVKAVANQQLDHTACEKEIYNLKKLVESRSRELDHSQHLLKEEYANNNKLEKKLAIIQAELDRALSSKKNNHELLVEAKQKISDLENNINKINNERKSLEAEKNDLLGKLEMAQTLLSDVQTKYDMVERDLNRGQERNFEMKRRQIENNHNAEIAIMRQQIEQMTDKLEKKTCDLESLNSRYQALQQSHQMMLCDKSSKINDLNHALNECQSRCKELLSKPNYEEENIRLLKLIANLQEQTYEMEKTINSLKESLELTTAELNSMDILLQQHNQEDTDTPRKQSQTEEYDVGSTHPNSLDSVSHLKKELYRALANIKCKREEVRKLQKALDDKQAEIIHLRQEENNSLVQISTLKEENIKLQNKLKILEKELDQLQLSHDTEAQEERDDINTLHIQLEDLKGQLKIKIQRIGELEEYKLHQECERKKLDAQLKNLEIDLEEHKQEHESLKLSNNKILQENFSLKQRKTAENTRLELEKHKFLLRDAQAECDRLKNLYVEISNGKETLSYEIDKLLKMAKENELQGEKEKVANLQRALQLEDVKYSELSKILETEQFCHEKEVCDLRDKLESTKAAKEVFNECSKCMEYAAKLKKFEIQNLKLSNVNAINKKEIDELTTELKNSKDHIVELNGQLKTSEQQEQLIKELKTKAEQFEEYIKSQSSASEASNSPIKSVRDLSDKNISTSPELERNEIRKIEARIRDEMSKIFALELKRFQIKLHDTQEQSLCLQREYQYINAELQQRQVEVELLKQAIFAEREQMDEILKRKDQEYKDILQKQNICIQKTRDELKVKIQKITDLTHELNERQTQIEAERKSMKAVMKQWEEQRKTVDDVEMDWKQKFTDLQKAHESAIQSWQTKYNSAKRTAANYKRYSEDKETHMLKEYDRLKIEYDAQLAKIQMRMKESLEKKSLELNLASDKQHCLSNNKENTANN